MTSVAARSPVCGSKRSRLVGLEGEDERHSPHLKRIRHYGVQGHCQSSRSGALLRLFGLFPSMDEKVISGALTECDGDVEAAIKRLNQLTLVQCAGEDASLPMRAESETEKAQEEAESELDKWSEAICAEMAAAGSVVDARLRAKRFLARCKAHIEACQRAKDAESLNHMAKENALLKRAVAIQHSRMTAAAEKEQQFGQLQAMLGQYQERVRALEMSNYSLSLHLKQATGGQVSAMDGGPPDVC